MSKARTKEALLQTRRQLLKAAGLYWDDVQRLDDVDVYDAASHQSNGKQQHAHRLQSDYLPILGRRQRLVQHAGPFRW